MDAKRFFFPVDVEKISAECPAWNAISKLIVWEKREEKSWVNWLMCNVINEPKFDSS